MPEKQVYKHGGNVINHDLIKEIPAEILVVEDTLDNLELLNEILSKQGYNVRPASSGQIALRYLSAREPDLILLDVKLPDIDGFEVCRRLKSIEKNLDIPVIFISAFSEIAEKMKGFEAGGVDYITKPFDSREVLARVRIHLSLKELNESLEDKVRERTEELSLANRKLQQEILERKETEKLLRESEEKYRMLVENIELGITLIDASHRIIMTNTHQAKLFRKPVDEFSGLECFREFEKRNAICPHCPGALAMITGKSQEVETEGIRDDGSSFPVRLYAFPTFTPDGIVNGFIEVVDDITEKKKAENALKKSEVELRLLNEELEKRVFMRTSELKEANEALSLTIEMLEQTQAQLVESEKMAALGNLVVGVAHEINTPLGNVLTAASFLDDEINGLEELYKAEMLDETVLMKFMETSKESCSLVLSNLNRAIGLITSFKQVAVDQSGGERRIFKPKEYLQEIILSLQHILKQSETEVIINCPEEIVLDNYPGAFYRIITNLIINSLVHGFRNRKGGIITIDLMPENQMVSVTVADNGIGIAPEHIKHIFEPFYTVSREAGSSGLGLHIVYNLVAQTLGGQIKCESNPGKGAKFLINFPINRSM